MRRIKRGVILVLGFAVAVAALQANAGYAQNYDHFKTYLTSGPPLMLPVEVELTDQFGTVGGMVDVMVFFSNPVEKTPPGEDPSPILHPDYHLTWYNFMGTAAGPFEISVSNQFGADQRLVVENPALLLLPAEKLLIDETPAGHSAPVGLDHYLCYDVTSAPMFGLAGVMLEDQFFSEEVEVGQARFFCNPAQKEVLGPPPYVPGLYPIIDPDNHLTCYQITSTTPPPFLSVLAEDQFGNPEFTVLQDEFLCVPSTKVLCEPEICDGIDNDCDGVVPADETDDDGDGYVECTPWGGSDPTVVGGGDCNDAAKLIYPSNPNTYCNCADPDPQGTTEIECNGIDEDCNGTDLCGGSCSGAVAE